MNAKILAGFILMCFLAHSNAFAQKKENDTARKDTAKIVVKKNSRN